MEQRVRQYHEEALKGKTNKSLKNMNNFRKFIHKNQDYDFSDREKVGSTLTHAIRGEPWKLIFNISSNVGL